MNNLKLIVALASAFVLAALVGCGGGGGAEESASSAADTSASAAVSVSASASSDVAETSASASASSAKEEDALEKAVNDYWANFPAEGNNQLPADKIFEKIDAGEDMIILDIRSAEDYAAGHLKGAVNIPYAKVGENLEAIPDDKDIWINCYTGQTSSQTTALLSFAGKKAHNIQSGWDRGISKTEGYEAYVETEANELPAGTYPVDPDIKKAIEDYYAAAANDPHKAYNFPADELMASIDAGNTEYTILSVRKAEDYDAGHIPGAINIPFGKGMQESFGDIPMDKPVVVYCYTGQTASQVMASLRMLGYEAYNLSGGMGKAPEGDTPGFGWLENNLPVISTADEGAKAA